MGEEAKEEEEEEKEELQRLWMLKLGASIETL